MADASLRAATGEPPDIGDSSEIFQTRETVVNRTYVIKFDVWVDSASTTAGHVNFCQEKDVNGVLIIRNTAEVFFFPTTLSFTHISYSQNARSLSLAPCHTNKNKATHTHISSPSPPASRLPSFDLLLSVPLSISRSFAMSSSFLCLLL